ncbi:hypothetical protein BKA60DRAFT_161315 [Fusarium oxysporum]|nr:hypothetical protein BKA60DRAFT_161315 [Fusarium oxysporum]
MAYLLKKLFDKGLLFFLFLSSGTISQSSEMWADCGCIKQPQRRTALAIIERTSGLQASLFIIKPGDDRVGKRKKVALDNSI